MKLTWFGHAAFRLDLDGAVVLIDPFLTGNSWFDGDPEKAAQGATHICLTHGHSDHIGNSVEIAKRTGAQLVSNFEVCQYLQAKGVENINPGNPGGTVECGAFRVTFTPANHSSGVVEDGQFIYLGTPMGLVLEGESLPTIYHMGDTNMFGDMALIQEFHQPQIGLVPIGDRFTMGGRQAAIACRRFFDFRTIVPMHYKTFPIIDQSPDIFLEYIGDQRDRVRIPNVGEAFEV